MPGVAVNRTTGLTQLRLRDSEANQTLVLVDGIEASDPFLSEFDFGSLVDGGIPCLHASLNQSEYSGYLCVLPGEALARTSSVMPAPVLTWAFLFYWLTTLF